MMMSRNVHLSCVKLLFRPTTTFMKIIVEITFKSISSLTENEWVHNKPPFFKCSSLFISSINFEFSYFIFRMNDTHLEAPDRAHPAQVINALSVEETRPNRDCFCHHQMTVFILSGCLNMITDGLAPLAGG